MRVISRKALVECWTRPDCRDAEGPLRAWFKEVQQEAWETPADVKQKYASASVLKSGWVVFNIGGNKYRLVVEINYVTHVLFVRFVGTHAEYDKLKLR